MWGGGVFLGGVSRLSHSTQLYIRLNFRQHYFEKCGGGGTPYYAEVVVMFVSDVNLWLHNNSSYSGEKWTLIKPKGWGGVGGGVIWEKCGPLYTLWSLWPKVGSSPPTRLRA